MDNQTRQLLKAEVENLSKEIASIQQRLNSLLNLLNSNTATPELEVGEPADFDVLIEGESVKNYSYEEFFQNITSRIRHGAPDAPRILFRTNRVTCGNGQGGYREKPFVFTADKFSLYHNCSFNKIRFNLRNKENRTIGTVAVEFSTVKDEDGEELLEGSTIKDVRVTLHEEPA